MPSARLADWQPARPAAAIRADATITRFTLMNFNNSKGPPPAESDGLLSANPERAPRALHRPCQSGRIGTRGGFLPVLQQHVQQQQRDAAADGRVGDIEDPGEPQPR